MYKVLLERQAEKDLKRLPPDIFKRVLPLLKQLAENPKPPGCLKLIGAENDWRIRVGDYRLVYEIDNAARVVRIWRIRHRREVYR